MLTDGHRTYQAAYEENATASNKIGVLPEISLSLLY